MIVRSGKDVIGYLDVCPHDHVKLDWVRNQFLDPNGLAPDVRQARLDVRGRYRACGGRPLQGAASIALAVLDGDICVTGVELVEDDEAKRV